MPVLEYDSIDVDNQKYNLTFAEFSSNDSKKLVAVTDTENDIHYVSSELECYSTDDLMPTSTIPDGYGLPSQIEESVPVRVMDEIENYFTEGKNGRLKESLSKLGENLLESDSQENEVKVEEKLETLSWQGINPDKIDEKQYPKAYPDTLL